ncbi:MYND-type domain-containing protein [Mycena sanguinolenta]|uniref:MYND-type domain-containing protein n=1 Tax=Mycena sanguinolenta TaxID=230812 RepID=A0A8H7DA84_9AGAR|nr:MYND-type domain-containing protein [Mycena sanguinolenta]
MHPCLKLSNLSRLPSPLRARANAAVAGSRDEIVALSDEIPEIAPENLPFLLPLFYALIDTAHIPVALRELRVPGRMPRTIQAVLALRAFFLIMKRYTILSEALLDLWMRAAPWIEFLDEYREHLFSLETLPPRMLYSIFVGFLRRMRENGRNAQVVRLMDESLGLCVVVARAWRHLIDTEGDQPGLLNVANFLVHRTESNDGWDTASFHALLVGAGGPTGFASLLVSHFRRVVSRSDSTITDDTPSLLSGGTWLLCSRGAVEAADAFDDALLSLGFVTTLTTVAQALRHGPEEDAHPILSGVVSVLMFYLSFGSCNTGKRITESLRAGLLPAIISSATVLGEIPDSRLDSLLRTVLPASTVYHSVLSQLRISLAEMSQRDAIRAFAEEGLLDIWKKFSALVESRVQILDKYNRGELKAKRVCDHLECSKNCYTHELRRCGDCSMAYYCSEACQSGDWHAGHRLMCAALARRYYAQSHREKSFMRALIHHEYTTNLEQIALKHLLFMCRTPFLMPHILFDYTEGNCTISVLLPDKGECHPQCHSPCHSPYDFQRVANSGGRIQLHVMKVAEGKKTRTWLFAQKSSPEFFDGLKAIAHTLLPQPSRADLLKCLPAIRNLISSTQK